jgi:hypothetical protein
MYYIYVILLLFNAIIINLIHFDVTSCMNIEVCTLLKKTLLLSIKSHHWFPLKKNS